MDTKPNNRLGDVSAMSFEQALKELETIVRKLETGQEDLENAIDDYALGTVLKEHCQKKLDDARMKVEKIISTKSGVTAVAFDADSQG